MSTISPAKLRSPLTAPSATPEAITAIIERLAAKRETLLPDGRVRSIDPFAVSNAAGKLLERAASAAPPGAVIEVGCASGLSSLHMARGRLAASHLKSAADYHIMDPKQSTHWDGMGRMHLGQANLNQLVTFHEHSAHAVLPTLLADDLRVGFAFLDGWHMLDYVMVEAFYVDLMLAPGGVIAIHDMWMPGLQHFACFWLTNRPYEAVTVATDQSGHLHLAPQPCHSDNRAVGDLLQAPPMFKDQLVPFIDESILLLRKLDDDRRSWDAFQPYNRA
jgi:predicted O-methyltransferase YrrM